LTQVDNDYIVYAEKKSRVFRGDRMWLGIRYADWAVAGTKHDASARLRIISTS
jgi:hypothetical protein